MLYYVYSVSYPGVSLEYTMYSAYSLIFDSYLRTKGQKVSDMAKYQQIHRRYGICSVVAPGTRDGERFRAHAWALRCM